MKNLILCPFLYKYGLKFLPRVFPGIYLSSTCCALEICLSSRDFLMMVFVFFLFGLSLVSLAFSPVFGTLIKIKPFSGYSNNISIYNRLRVRSHWDIAKSEKEFFLWPLLSASVNTTLSYPRPHLSSDVAFAIVIVLCEQCLRVRLSMVMNNHSNYHNRVFRLYTKLTNWHFCIAHSWKSDG